MKSVRDLQTLFPDDVDTIATLCSVNPVFDEICNDFQLMYAELRKATKEEPLDSNSAHSQAWESYSALRDEIAEILRRGEHTNQKK